MSLIGALVVAGIAVPTWQQTRLQRVRSENAQLRAQTTPSQAQETEVGALRSEVERLRKVEADQAELQRLRQWQAQTEPELLRLRGMAGVARRAGEAGTNLVSGAMVDAMKQAMNQHGRYPLTREADAKAGEVDCYVVSSAFEIGPPMRGAPSNGGGIERERL